MRPQLRAVGVSCRSLALTAPLRSALARRPLSASPPHHPPPSLSTPILPAATTTTTTTLTAPTTTTTTTTFPPTAPSAPVWGWWWGVLPAAIVAFLLTRDDASAEEPLQPRPVPPRWAPNGFVATTIRALLTNLQDATSSFSRTNYIRAIQAMATKPATAQLLWEQDVVKVLYEVSLADPTVFLPALRCLTEVVLQHSQFEELHRQTSEARAGTEATHLSSLELQRWASLWEAPNRNPLTAPKSLLESARILDQVVADLPHYDRSDGVGEQVAAKDDHGLSVRLRAQLLRCYADFIDNETLDAPPPRTLAHDADDMFSMRNHEIPAETRDEVRMLVVRGLSNLVARDALSAEELVTSNLLFEIQRRWYSTMKPRCLAYFSRLVSRECGLPVSYQNLLVEHGYLNLLNELSLSKDKQVRLSVALALGHLIKDEAIAIKIFTDFGFDLFIELASMVDIEVQTAVEEVLTSLSRSQFGAVEEPSPRRLRGDWKLDQDFEFV